VRLDPVVLLARLAAVTTMPVQSASAPCEASDTASSTLSGTGASERMPPPFLGLAARAPTAGWSKQTHSRW
jgi:hypothetical protein